MAWSMAALVASTVLTATAPAGGAPAPSSIAVVAVGHCDGASTAIAARSFRTLVQPRLGAALQDEAQTARPLGGLAERTLEEIDRAVAAARKDFYAHRVDPALVLLRALAADVVRQAPSEQRWRVEREVGTLIAQVELAADPAAAETAVVAILRVEPGYQPDTALYPPTFRKFVDGVRERLAEIAASRLDVAVSPPGTLVYVGGKPVGAAPLSLHVTPGEYRVEADFGHRGLLRVVRVPAPPALASPVELGAGVEGAILPDAGPCVEPGSDPATRLARLAALAGAQRLYAVRSETSGGRAWMAVAEVDASGQVVREARAPVQPGAPESEALAGLAEWTATGKPAARVEVLKRAGAGSPGTGRGQLSGRVLGQPAPAGFRLHTFPEAWEGAAQPEAVHFDGDRFKRTDAPAGRTSVQVVTDDGRVGAMVVDVPAGGAVEAQVHVQRACTAVGRVVNSAGRPVGGARVRAEQLGAGFRQAVDSGPRGFFVFRELLRGEYRLTVQAGERRLERRFSLTGTCKAELGAVTLPDAVSSSAPAPDAGTPVGAHDR